MNFGKDVVYRTHTQQRIDQPGPLELKELLRIGVQVASGLAAAHARGLIHCDIKPSNIMLENCAGAGQDHRLRPCTRPRRCAADVGRHFRRHPVVYGPGAGPG